MHPSAHGGLLAIRDNANHQESVNKHKIQPIDLLCANLYSFEQTVASGNDYATIIENIAIGGPAMVRAAAKNHAGVTVVVDPADYPQIIESIKKNGNVSRETQQKLAARIF